MTTLKRFTELTYLTAAQAAVDDVVPIVDISEGETEAASRIMTVAELRILLEVYFKGYFVDEAALILAYSVGQTGWYAIVGDTDTVWTWDDGTAAWVDTDTKGEVTSVFTRTGPVIAAASDYDASQVDNDSGVPGDFVDNALNNLLPTIKDVDLSATTDIVFTFETRIDLIADSTAKEITSISNGQYDGQLIVIRIDTSDNTVKLPTTLGNVTLNGNWFVRRINSNIILRWDDTSSKWIEVTRTDGNNLASGLHGYSSGYNNVNLSDYASVGGYINDVDDASNYAFVYGSNNVLVTSIGAAVFGSSNAVTSARSLVAGTHNVAGGDRNFISGGYNTSNGQSSGCIGECCQSNEDYALALGFGANSRIKGMVALASQGGDSGEDLAVSQGGLIQQQCYTNEDVTLYFAPIITIPDDNTVAVIGLITARQIVDLGAGAVGDSAAWKFEALMKHVTGSGYSLIASSVTLIGKDGNFSALPDPVIEDDLGGGLGVEVTGEVDKGIRWGCVVKLSEVNELTA